MSTCYSKGSVTPKKMGSKKLNLANLFNYLHIVDKYTSIILLIIIMIKFLQ